MQALQCEGHFVGPTGVLHKIQHCGFLYEEDDEAVWELAPVVTALQEKEEEEKRDAGLRENERRALHLVVKESSTKFREFRERCGLGTDEDATIIPNRQQVKACIFITEARAGPQRAGVVAKPSEG
jgi:hypothetical protein